MDQAMRKGFEDEFEKHALIERLARLARTPIRSLDWLGGRIRSPQELAEIQHGVEQSLKRFQDPAVEKIKDLAGGIKHERIRKAVSSAAEDVVRHPVEWASHLLPLPIPGSSTLIHGGMTATRKGLERAIDRHWPAAALK